LSPHSYLDIIDSKRGKSNKTFAAHKESYFMTAGWEETQKSTRCRKIFREESFLEICTKKTYKMGTMHLCGSTPGS
jgi:hypothetical protein